MKVKYLGAEPKIKVKFEAFIKMQNYVALSKDEIGWLGTVDVQDNTYTITDVFLLRQEVNGATCELGAVAIAEFYEERTSSGLSIDNIAMWGHSHVYMGVSPSSQDDVQLAELGKHSSFFIRAILNKQGVVNLCLIDNEKNIQFEEIAWEVDMCGLEDQIGKEIQEKVTYKKYTPATPISSLAPYYSVGGKKKKKSTYKNGVVDEVEDDCDYTWSYIDGQHWTGNEYYRKYYGNLAAKYEED